MEEIGATNPKYQPLRVLWRPFVRPRSKNHPFGTYSLVNVLFDIHDTSFPYAPYKLLPSIKNILGARRFLFLSFYFLSFFYFHRTLFVGLRDTPA